MLVSRSVASLTALTALTVSLGGLAGCTTAARTEASIVRLSGGDIVTISPEQMSRYTCEPSTLVCESISGGGRFARRQCTCASGPPTPAR